MPVAGEEGCAGSHLLENSYRVFLPILQQGRARQGGTPYEADDGSVRTSRMPSAQPSQSTNKHAHRLREHTSPAITGTTNARTTADSDFRPLGIRRRSTLELESLIARPGHPQRSSRLNARPVLDKSNTSGLRMTPSSNKHLGHTTIRKP
ncbi:hypothetical protein CRG98_012176 [Punica granatum]|uniref:Uncharacterized protein n=1 Tax=Punica granatum TaxID=22663 RepID=A0A2I0KHZ0_PUNGR|nr:hypothetical protein CRG98_012176 [Punica granatum]